MSPFRNEAAYTQTLGREFNMLVAENAMKFDAMHPAQNTYNFTDADALVAYAEANDMVVRGHTLVWHSQIPGWLTGGNFTRDQVIAIMRDHIMTVVGRYRGRILAWDVVNEAVSDNNGQMRTDSSGIRGSAQNISRWRSSSRARPTRTRFSITTTIRPRGRGSPTRSSTSSAA